MFLAIQVSCSDVTETSFKQLHPAVFRGKSSNKLRNVVIAKDYYDQLPKQKLIQQGEENVIPISALRLRWSETKNLKISNPDNIFFLYLIIIKLCTLKQLENIHQKLRLKFS